RPAIADLKIPRLRRQPDRLLLIQDTELDQKIREIEFLQLVDDDAHGTFFAMCAQVDDRASEAFILHARHGDEELVIQEAAFGLHIRTHHVHTLEPNAIRACLASTLLRPAEPSHNYDAYAIAPGLLNAAGKTMFQPCSFHASQHF